MQPQNINPGQIRILETALLTGPVLFAVVVGFLTAGDPSPQDIGLPESLPWGFAAFAVASLPIAFFAGRAARGAVPASGGRHSSRHARARIVSMAVLEAAMLANLTMWLATREQWPNAVAALLPFCGGLAQLLTPLRSDDDASAAL